MAAPIRYGMVGGGRGAFIGGVHRIAARLDGAFELVAGALSSDPRTAMESAADIGIAPDRAYADFTTMAKQEAARADGIEAVAIVTPNHMHFPVAKAFLEAGIHVICDKPMTATLDEARALRDIAASSGRLFVLTHNYSGYPMIREARDMVRGGVLGSVRLVEAEYVQDWLTEPAERSGNAQAQWRTDPERSGAGGALGDIGTHAFHLARFVTGLEPAAVLADLDSFVAGRRLDDNAHVLLRFAGGAKGMLWASQVAPGNENGLALRIYGDKGGLEWRQEHPNQLWHAAYGEPRRLLSRGGPGLGATAQAATRVPAGHPEGYLEGFATLYSDAAALIRQAREGGPPPGNGLLPGVEDGVEGVAFVAACVRSSAEGNVWVKLDTV